jgi:hypothetical protein
MAALQQALQQHERVRKATELPLFYGEKSKDTIDPEDFIRRFNAASDLAGWVAAPAAGQPRNYRIKCQQFLSLLRNKAIEWWHSLELNPDNNYEDWDYIHDKFLQHYSPRYTARTACMSFADLHQQNDESVGDYYLRVTKAYRLLKKQRPENIADLRHAPAPLDPADGAVEINNGLNAAMQAAKNEGLDDMGRYMVQAMFLAGLKEEIRIKTMETRPNTHEAAYQTALNIECILKDRRGSKPIVSQITYEDDEDEDFEVDDEEEELLDQINAIRVRRGRKPARFAPRGNGQKVNIICRYCKATGHFQRDCFKRKKENGKMIDANGKPYRINQIEEEKTVDETSTQKPEEEQAVQSIRDPSLSQLYFGINSIRDVTGEGKNQVPPNQPPLGLPLDTQDRCMCLRIWDIRKESLSMVSVENTIAFLNRHGMTSIETVDEDKWICTCLEDMMQFRHINQLRSINQGFDMSEWDYYIEPDPETQEILEDTVQMRSEWFDDVGEPNPFEDEASRNTPSPTEYFDAVEDPTSVEDKASQNETSRNLN